MSIFNKVKLILTEKEKINLIVLILFSVLVAIVETTTITSIMPFIDLSTNPQKLNDNKYYSFFYNYFSFEDKTSFIVSVGIVLVLYYIFRFFVNLTYTYFISKFAREKYRTISNCILEKTFNLSYNTFTNKNSAVLIKNIIQETNNFSSSLIYFLQLLSESLVFIFIYSVMLYINYKITLLISIIFTFCIFILYKTVSSQIKVQGRVREECQNDFYKILSSSFGNYKLFKFSENENLLPVKEFDIVGKKFSKSSISKDLLSVIPKLFIETFIFMVLILSILFILKVVEEDMTTFIPTLTLFALSLYRLMPSINKIISNYNNIIYHFRSIDILYEMLLEDSEKIGNKEISFNNNIKLDDVSFSYNSNSKKVLENINLIINKYDKVAFIGKSGSGKSTLIDIISGIYSNIYGEILIDGKKIGNENLKYWRGKIGYIPQQIYLFDGNVLENIAFGKIIDKRKIVNILKKVKMYDFLENEHQGIYTNVGDGGLKLSGGQKQRIAIARALYKNPEILILDEATSALDEETENLIMDEIYNLSKDKTLIIIAHRLNTIKNCNKVYKIKNKKLSLFGELANA